MGTAGPGNRDQLGLVWYSRVQQPELRVMEHIACGGRRYIETLLYGMKPTDPEMLILPLRAILTAACFAAAPPVIHALRIDPAVTLRAESGVARPGGIDVAST